jgi:hypothetical protein
MIACVLLSWLKLLALDGDLAKAEPKTLRRVLHAATRLVSGGRRRTLKIAAAWPNLGREDHHRMATRPGHPAPHLTSTKPSPEQGRKPRGPRNPGHPAHRHTPGLKSRSRNQPARTPAAAINPSERSRLMRTLEGPEGCGGAFPDPSTLQARDSTSRRCAIRDDVTGRGTTGGLRSSGAGQAKVELVPLAARRCHATAFKTSSPAPSCADPMCSMSRVPRREEDTNCTAVAPDAVFTVRTYGDMTHPTTPGKCADPLMTSNKPAGQRNAPNRGP